MHAVTFLPSRDTCAVRDGATLLGAVSLAERPLARSCRGVGVCGACRVRVVDGAGNLDPPGAAERELMRREGARGPERFACLARVRGDVAITTPYW